MAKILSETIQQLVPPPPEPTAQWAQKNIVLPRETGALQREFDLYYGPHLYGIFAAIDDPATPEIYCQKAAQVLWTTALICYIAKRICRHPGVILGMFATDSAAKKFSQTKFNPIGKATPEIASRINFTGSRKSGGSMLRKEFDGGFLEMFGSNAAGNVKSTTADFVFVEEPDDAADNVGDQGDSIKLLFERTKRVRYPKKILGGTPSLKGFSKVEQYIELSDKRELPVACHDCGEKHVLDFEYVHGWQAGDEPVGEKHPIFAYNRPDMAVYCCPHCGSVWDDFQRKENIRNTVAAAMEEGDPYCGWVPTQPFAGVAGFCNLNELYSCLPGVGVVELVKDYLEAEHYAAIGDNTKQIVFVNSKLGKPYELKDSREDAEVYRERALADPDSQHDELHCPEKGLLVTIGIDVQHNRLAVIIRAWGRDAESWLMYWGEIAAERRTADETDAVWSALDDLVFRPFKHASGAAIYASAISIDSSDGTTSEAVLNWVRSRSKKYPSVLLMAIKGSSSVDPEIFTQPRAKSLDHRRPDKMTKADRLGVKLYFVGTNKAKDLISTSMGFEGSGPGRFHYYNPEQMRADYFEQMTGEAKIPSRRLKGRKVWEQKPGRPVEAWDCEVYALHAARARRVNQLRPSQWDDMERQLLQANLFDQAGALIAKDTDDAKPTARRKSNYWDR